MNDYIAHGKIHANSKEQTYVAVEMEEFEVSCTSKQFTDAHEYLMEKMVDYLQEFYKPILKQMLIDCMMEISLGLYIKCPVDEPSSYCLNVILVYIPYCKNSSYAINPEASGRLCLKFKRAPEDNLDEQT